MVFRGHHLRRALRGSAVVLSLVLLCTLLPATAPEVAHAGGCRLRPTATDRARIRTIRKARPRVLADGGDIRRARRYSRTDETAAQWRAQLRRSADRLVGVEPSPYWKIGPRLQFFQYKNRITTLALAWRLEGDPRYVHQARREMLNAAQYPDWNPRHYLDTAEMTAATALGYDWFHEALDRDTRRRIRKAIVNKGLKTAKCFYRHGNGPVVRTSNWGIATNAGLAMGAVAVADTHRKLSGAILGNAVRRVRPAMRRFAGDGSYVEGLGYWRYATEHAVKLTATLESSFGTPFGIAGIGGFSRTGDHALHAIGPGGNVANFGDTPASLGKTPQLFWLARRFGRPVDAWLANELREESRSPLHLLWYSPRMQSPAAAGVSAKRLSRSLQTAFLRTRWDDPDASYTAVKGGSNAVPHAQPELGNFVFTSGGKRWALDLGLDDYNLPGYFDTRRRHRWYRLSTQGQNTLSVSGMQQPRTAWAPVTHFSKGRTRSEVVVNLSKAYPAARRVHRGVALIGKNRLMIRDEVSADRVVTVAWAMHTRADVEISADGRYATLTMGKQRMTARLVGSTSATARFSVVSAEQSSPQAPNSGIKRLQIRTTTAKALPGDRSRVSLTVLLSRGGLLDNVPRIERLAKW